MSTGYAKVFGRIVHSTIWREENPTRILWITMLAIADQDGVVSCTIPGLADIARITLEECERALLKFQQPDKYSWSQEEEGRRIRIVDGGWLLINHAKYRMLMSKEDRSQKSVARVRQWREKKRSETQRNAVLPSATDGNARNDMQIQKQKQIQKQEVKSTVRPLFKQVADYCKERGNLVDPTQWFNHYEANGWKVGRNPMKDWKAAVRTWEKNGIAGSSPPVEDCTRHPDSGRTPTGGCWDCYEESVQTRGKGAG